MDKPSRLALVLSLSLSALMIFTYFGLTYAAPMPPRIVVNHQTRQCAEIVPGDECGDVVLPPDWEYLDPDAGEKCPESYTLIDLSPDWVHFKVSFCCTEGHSGVSGDCEDVVIRRSGRQCAFVDDINSCANLPDGWKAHRENCPVDFSWAEDVPCSGGEAVQTPVETAQSLTGAAATPGQSGTPPATKGELSTPVSARKPAEARNPLLPCAAPGLALVMLFGAWFVRRWP